MRLSSLCVLASLSLSACSSSSSSSEECAVRCPSPELEPFPFNQETVDRPETVVEEEAEQQLFFERSDFGDCSISEEEEPVQAIPRFSDSFFESRMTPVHELNPPSPRRDPFEGLSEPATDLLRPSGYHEMMEQFATSGLPDPSVQIRSLPADVFRTMSPRPVRLPRDAFTSMPLRSETLARLSPEAFRSLIPEVLAPLRSETLARLSPEAFRSLRPEVLARVSATEVGGPEANSSEYPSYVSDEPENGERPSEQLTAFQEPNEPETVAEVPRRRSRRHRSNKIKKYHEEVGLEQTSPSAISIESERFSLQISQEAFMVLLFLQIVMLLIYKI